jgi:hypothetical protein
VQKNAPSPNNKKTHKNTQKTQKKIKITCRKTPLRQTIKKHTKKHTKNTKKTQKKIKITCRKKQKHE